MTPRILRSEPHRILRGPHANGSAVSTGFAPAAFTLNDGQAYTMEADGNGSCAFAYWLDSSDANNQRAISILSDASLTVVLSCSHPHGSA